MTLILSAVVPIFAIVLAGFVVGRLGLLGDAAVSVLNRFVYVLALPALLIGGLARIDLASGLRWEFAAAYAFGIAATALVACLAPASGEPGARTMRVVNATYGNTGYLGIPLALMLFGEAALAPASLTVAMHSALILPLAVAFLEGRKAPGGERGAVVRGTLRMLAASPLIWAVGLGMLLAGTGAAIPESIARFLALLGDAAAPCALLSIGLFVATRPRTAVRASVLIPTALKLGVFPIAVWLAATQFFSLDGMWLALAVLMAAAPLGATAFVLSERYGVSRDETSAAILITTALSLPILGAIIALGLGD